MILSAVVLTQYYPALNTGFVVDDWVLLRSPLTKSLPDYLIQSFDPRGQFIWYHPMSAILWRLEHTIFGVNALGYHLVHVLVHLANTLLLFGLVRRVTGNARAGLVSSIGYATMPLETREAVLWPADSQTPATLFYFLSIWVWFSYLQTETRAKYILAFSFAVLAVFTKATTITLPIMLILVDRLLVAKPLSPSGLIRRYLPFGLPVLPYLVSMYPLLSEGVFTTEFRYGIGLQTISNLIQYFAFLSFPWEPSSFITYLWLPVGILLILGFVIREHSRGLTFLGLSIPIMLFPYLLQPIAALRYLYTPVIIVAILIGLVFEKTCRTIRSSWFRSACALSLSLLIMRSGASIAEWSEMWAGASQLERLTFRNIAQRHSTFPEDTFLYFINGTDEAWSTLSLIHYGQNVSVSDISTPRQAGLRNHRNPLVIYIDAQGEPRELGVDMPVTTKTIPELPVEFEQSIRLEGYELTRERFKRGELLGLVLYWRAIQKLDKDYTVFVHLVDENGRIIEGYDSQPRDGNTPTSSWRAGVLMPDGRVFPIPEDAPFGHTLRLEIGLYYLPTMQRLSIVNSGGNPIGDTLIIGPLSIVE